MYLNILYFIANLENLFTVHILYRFSCTISRNNEHFVLQHSCIRQYFCYGLNLDLFQFIISTQLQLIHTTIWDLRIRAGCSPSKRFKRSIFLEA